MKYCFTEAAGFEDPTLLGEIVNCAYRMAGHCFQEKGGLLPLAFMVGGSHSKGNVATLGPILKNIIIWLSYRCRISKKNPLLEQNPAY